MKLPSTVGLTDNKGKSQTGKNILRNYRSDNKYVNIQVEVISSVQVAYLLVLLQRKPATQNQHVVEKGKD